MSRGHLYRKISDSQGNVVPNTVVTVYENGTTQPIVQQLYALAAGSGQVPNPFTTSDGFVSIWLDRPQSVRIGLQVPGATETYVDDVPVSVAPENLVLADYGFQIVGQPVDGHFLQHGQPGVAAWVDAGDLVNSKPSPLRQIYAYDFSGGSIEDITLTGPGGVVEPVFVDISADPKPLSWESFTGALQTPTGTVIRVPPQTFPESGTVIFLYKVVCANSAGTPATLRLTVDEGLMVAETPTVADLTNLWLVGYLDDVPSGSRRVAIEHRAGGDPTSHVLLGPVWLQYGNNIPAHTHEGAGTSSVRLGVGSAADHLGATSVGANAKSLGDNATLLGFGAQGNANSVALGAATVAGTDAVVAGLRAATPAGKHSGVAIGKDAVAAQDEAVAVGAVARALGPGAIALGPGALTGSGADSIALGASAQALADRSVAIGRGAFVAAGHTNSVAIGPGVATTAANQARIGDASTTVVIPGALRQVGGEALFGGPTTNLGFYGSAGIARPTVLGSRSGNTTLASLLAVLDSMGLIRDQTTT